MGTNVGFPVCHHCASVLSGRCASYPSHMRSPWSHQCLSSAQHNYSNLARNPNQASAEATLRNQARNKNICRKSRNFIESSILCCRDTEKPKNRENGVGRRKIPIRRDGEGPTLRGCQSHGSWGDNGTGHHILQSSHPTGDISSPPVAAEGQGRDARLS